MQLPTPLLCISSTPFSPPSQAPASSATPSSSVVSLTTRMALVFFAQLDQARVPGVGDDRHLAHAGRLEQRVHLVGPGGFGGFFHLDSVNERRERRAGTDHTIFAAAATRQPRMPASHCRQCGKIAHAYRHAPSTTMNKPAAAAAAHVTNFIRNAIDADLAARQVRRAHLGRAPRPRGDARRRAARSGEDPHALPARAQRLPALRPRQVDLPQLRPRARLRRRLPPALRRHQPGEGRAGVRRFHPRRGALAGLRLERQRHRAPVLRQRLLRLSCTRRRNT